MIRRDLILGLFAAAAIILNGSAPAAAEEKELSDTPSVLSEGGDDAAETAQSAQDAQDAEELARERDERARATFLAAQTAFEEGRYEDALAGFRRAYELSGRHQLLFNVGTTADRLRREEEALEAFTIYVRENPNAGNRREVEARMRVLERSIESRRAAEEEKEEERRRAAEAERALVELHQSRATENGEGMSRGGKRALIASSAIVGAAVVGLVIGLVISGDSPEGDDQAYAPYRGGTDGSVIFALKREPLLRW